MKKIAVIAVLLVGALFGGCTCFTSQERARHWGGTQTVELEPDEKLEFVTWKEDELWWQTRPMRPGEQPETHTFHQQKAGIGPKLDGAVVFIERAK